MRLHLQYVSPRPRLKSAPAQALVDDFLARLQRYQPAVLQAFRSEGDLFQSVATIAGRARPFVVLLDSRGRQLSSEQFAALLGQRQDSGTQDVLLAIGPADGWSAESRARADLLFSLGTVTLPHELALVILTEQTYRALTILAGHPYHNGHD